MELFEKLDILSAVDGLSQFTEKGKKDLYEALTEESNGKQFDTAEEMLDYIESTWRE